jgi:two-component system chemotaxis response regulator CheB
MKISPVPVVMLSSYTGEGALETLDALELGAVDFFLKDNLIKNSKDYRQIHEFLQRLKAIAQATLPKTDIMFQPKVKESKKGKQRIIELLFIGCSTGGPSALQMILPRFPKDFPIPIVVAQHMPPSFTKPLAERFNNLCQLNVEEVKDDQVVLAGTIYIAPSGYQTKLKKRLDGTVIFKVENSEMDQTLYKPCIDITVGSAAQIYKDRLLSVILTGMGTDGTKGCELVKKYGGYVFVEAEESCIVYGMPKSVLEAGYADGQYLISRIYDEVNSFIEFV